MSDYEGIFLNPLEDGKKKKASHDAKLKTADWRNGPAQLWYDMLNVSQSGEGFNYGFKMKQSVQGNHNKNKENIPDESFLMVAQHIWEDDIIWDDNPETKEKVLKNLDGKINAAGWLPSTATRTAQAFNQTNKAHALLFGFTNNSSANKITNKHSVSSQSTLESTSNNMWYSIFPIENEELIYGTWEDEIIWDSEAVTQIPKPKVLTLDPNDENIILGIPDDIDPQKQRTENTAPIKVKITHPHIKKSKLLLGKAGVINILKDEIIPPLAKTSDDPFNISNDSYYFPQLVETSQKLKVGGGNLIQHSTSVVELRAPFIQTQIEFIRLKEFHRPLLNHYTHGAISNPGPHAVMSLTKYIKKKAKMREQERIASGGGDMFFMRTAEDLTGRDGELILVEFCEEHPPLINQVGMCSKVKNYYKRKVSKDEGPIHYRYGETAYAHTSPFLGVLPPGKSMQVIENNMYRAPIYEHKIAETDFLVIRTRNQYFIREFDALFTAGQLCPLFEVPGPNSKQANNFIRDFLQVFIYRLFWQSNDTPKRIRMDDIKKAFPSHSESSIRKRLKLCADFKRTGSYSNWWVIKPDFRLPPEEEIRAMVSPEQCCAYFSMIATEQRLKDAGYGEKSLFTPEDDDEDLQLKMDDEIKVAPWNTTRAYVQAAKGKCLLQLTGSADPTGCGEGFSYIRMPIKPINKHGRETQDVPQKRIVTGTDADLRRLSLDKARDLLRKFGVPEEEINKLSRWEVIDVVRTLSTEKAKAGEEGMTKFSRGNRFSIAEHQERYKEECQRLFDIQNRVLSSSEILSTDEEETSQDEDNDFDLEEMAKNIENMLANKKSIAQMSMEKEKQERWNLRKLMLFGRRDHETMKDRRKRESNFSNSCLDQSNRILKIYRTFRNSDGSEYTRMEVVRKQSVIDAYIKIKSKKSIDLLKHLNRSQNRETRHEKRYLQEQLRRNRRSSEKHRLMTEVNNLVTIHASEETTKVLHDHAKEQYDEVTNTDSFGNRKSRPMKMKPDLKVKCGACGATGHMRTNRACPQYALNAPLPPINVALTQEQEYEISKQINDNIDDLINLDGTKVKISGKLIKHAEDIKRRSLQLKIPKESLVRKRRKLNTDQFDYLKKRQKPANRQRIDPLVELSSLLENILNEMRAQTDVQPFLFPVNAKDVPDYYSIITNSMDLQTMRDNLRQKKYQTREDFLNDVNQIVENSKLYNGAQSQLTLAAQNILQICVDRLAEKEDKLMKLEKMINPLLDDDDQVALSFILTNIVNKLKAMSESWPFVKPVNKKTVKDYYDVVKHPMDLETISNNVNAHKYHSRNDFLNDIKLILNNCVTYNGRGSSFSVHAEILLSTAQTYLEEYDEHLSILEQNIKLVQEKAEIESLNSSWYSIDDDHNQDFFDNTFPFLKSQSGYINMDTESQEALVKAEILAEDLHCSSEDGEADDDLAKEVRKNLDDLKYTSYDRQIPSVSTTQSLDFENYSYYADQKLETDLFGENFASKSVDIGNLSLEHGFLFSRDEAQNEFSHYEQMMCDISHQSIGAMGHDFGIISLDDEKERFIDIPEEVMTPYSLTSSTQDHNPDSLWF